MKKPITIISNDWHLAESNLEVIPGLVLQEIELAKRLEITTLVGLGDFFQERKAQKEAVLNTFKKCLDLIHENGMKLKNFYLLEYFYYFGALAYYRIGDIENYQNSLLKCFVTLHLEGNEHKIQKFTGMINSDFNINFSDFVIEHYQS
ncbi:MAG: hypothetical protein EOM67_15790, partial [Spirochaetia bacterium]|nr:hypothetical protein [Spirochaetia bacterium]